MSQELAHASSRSLPSPPEPTALTLSVARLDTSAKHILPPKPVPKSSHKSLPAPVKTETPMLQLNTHREHLLSASSPTMEAPITPVSPTAAAVIQDEQPITADQILTFLSTACSHLSRLSSKIKDGAKLLRKLEYIKDQFLERKEEIERFESIPFVQKWLWELRRAAVTFNDKCKKLENSLLSTAEGKRRRLTALLIDIHDAWSELMMNVTLAIAGKSSRDAHAATGSVVKLAIASGHPDWEMMTEDDAMKICIQADKYLFGYGVTRSYDMAFKRYMAAAKFGLAEASNMLGCMFEYGLGRDPDMPTAMYWYKEAVASQQYPEAMNNLGRIYETGKSIPKDVGIALDYYLKAAESGHPDAQTNIGFMLENAVGCKQDLKKAISWYKTAADTSDYARAQNCLGCIYYSGKGGIEKDYGLAIKYFRKAANQGNAHAQNNLGICFEEGLGVVRDYAAAKEMYKKASEGNHPSGTNNLGYIYLLERNYEMAMKSFLLAHALGSIDAAFNMATLYESGVLHPKGEPDLACSFKYFEEAAKKNHIKAQLKVSDMYMKGKGTSQNIKEGKQWLEKCCELNCGEAMNRLGQLYELGVGVEQDIEVAKKWYAKALALGHDGAMSNLGALYEIGIGVDRNLDKALKLYQQAEKRGNVDAKKRLNELREMAIDVDVSIQHLI